MDFGLEGKRFLVTGASRGIGMAIIKTLLDEGAEVVAQYNRSPAPLEKLKEKFGEKLIPAEADLSQPESVVDLFESAVEGELAGAVFNAGIAMFSPIDAPMEEWMSQWRATMAVNFDAPGMLTKLFVDYFRKQGGGRLVYITSRAIHRGDTIEYMAYGASKAGMANLLKSVARSEGKNGIMAFGIAPGVTRTDMAQDFINEYGESVALDDIVLDRLTEPRDIAPMVALLLCGKGDHSTGSIIDINAGSYVR